MESLLFIAGLIIAALLFRPAPRPHTIYVMSEPVEDRDQRGCLPQIGAAVVVVLVLVALIGIPQ